MPVLNQVTEINYTANGVTTVFVYAFKIISANDLLVTVDNVVKILTTDYTVSGVGTDAGGNVTFLVAPANSLTVNLIRNMLYIRETDYQENGDFLAQTVDSDIDRTVLLIQQLNQKLSLSIKTIFGVSTNLPTPVANNFLGWNSAANAIINYAGVVSSLAVSSFMSTVLAASNAAAARVLLVCAGLTSNTFTGNQTLAAGAALNTSISTLASSATIDIFNGTSNVIELTGVANVTSIAAAPQAGMSRTLILAGAASFTAGANMLIDGVVSFTGAAGDEVEVFAVTTTQFRLRPRRASGSSVPTGTIISFAGTSAPSGYLACPLTLTNISRTTYAALFAAIGTTWGAGDGTTTFGLPWFPASYAPVQANANVGTSSTGQVQGHTHAIGQPNGALSDGGVVKGNPGVTVGTQSPTGDNLAAGVRILFCVKF